MTAPCRRLPLVVVFTMLSCALGGCITFEEPTGPVPNMDQRLYKMHKAVSFRLGDMWVVRPPYEINATGVVITRTNLSAPGSTPEPTPAPGVDADAETVAADQPAMETDAAADGEQPVAPSQEQGVVDVEAEAAGGGPQPKPQEKLAANQQRLSIDLVTGRATLRDTDGRVYPQQVDRNVTQRIQDMLLARQWQVQVPKPAIDAAPIYLYRLDIYNADYRYTDTITWHAPANKPLPQALQMLVSTFQVAHRYAYPLSEDVNLLR